MNENDEVKKMFFDWHGNPCGQAEYDKADWDALEQMLDHTLLCGEHATQGKSMLYQRL